MATKPSPYPNLVFNPVPGSTTDVTDLLTRLNAAADVVTETDGLLTRLRNNNDAVWKGDAGEAFRSSFDATLSTDLSQAQQGLVTAARVMQEWSTSLTAFQDTAAGLESEAATARADHAKATAVLSLARTNPDLKLANRMFTDQNELAIAQAKLDAASAQLANAAAAVNDCQARIDAIIARALALESNHHALATRIASELQWAANNFAPTEDFWNKVGDFLSDIGDWFADHHDAFAATAAIAGLLAITTPPPIDAIALGVSLVAGGAALIGDAADDELRDDLLHGSGWERFGAVATIGGDALALLPGGMGVAKTAKFILPGESVEGVSRVQSMATAWGDAAHNPGWMAQKMTDNNILGINNELKLINADKYVPTLLTATTKGDVGMATTYTVTQRVFSALEKSGMSAYSTLRGDE